MNTIILEPKYLPYAPLNSVAILTVYTNIDSTMYIYQLNSLEPGESPSYIYSYVQRLQISHIFRIMHMYIYNGLKCRKTSQNDSVSFDSGYVFDLVQFKTVRHIFH